MLRLVGFELKKLIGKRTIFPALLVLSLLDLIKIAGVYKENSYLYRTETELSDWKSVHRRLYEDYRGKITQESIDRLLRLFSPIEAEVAELTASTRLDDPDTMTGSIYGDYNLLRRYFVLPMEEFYYYGIKAGQVAEAAKSNAAFYRTRGNEYEARKNACLYHQFLGRRIDNFAYMEMVNYYVNYDFSNGLLLLFCLYAISGLFAAEKESGMEQLLLVSPRGGRSEMAAKIAAAGLFLTGCSLWFSCVDFIGFGLAFGTFEGFTMPIYAIGNFSASPLSVSVGIYAVISALTRAMGIWATGMLLLLIARPGKNALMPFLAGMLVCLGLVILGSEYAGSGRVWIKVLNPFTLIQNRIVYAYSEFVNVAGYPVPAYIAAILAVSLSGLLLSAAVFRTAASNRLNRKRRAGI